MRFEKGEKEGSSHRRRHYEQSRAESGRSPRHAAALLTVGTARLRGPWAEAQHAELRHQGRHLQAETLTRHLAIGLLDPHAGAASPWGGRSGWCGSGTMVRWVFWSQLTEMQTKCNRVLLSSWHVPVVFYGSNHFSSILWKLLSFYATESIFV